MLKKLFVFGENIAKVLCTFPIKSRLDCECYVLTMSPFAWKKSTSTLCLAWIWRGATFNSNERIQFRFVCVNWNSLSFVSENCCENIFNPPVVNNDLQKVSLCPHLHYPSINCPSYPASISFSFNCHVFLTFLGKREKERNERAIPHCINWRNYSIN